ncbi:MAG: SGNH/GDSL hydrolase family protein [Acidiferrobacterales bacterium]|nr:SGNH/GDSL hydrolase family protein [Acidiferrobacterales bacterium]
MSISLAKIIASKCFFTIVVFCLGIAVIQAQNGFNRLIVFGDSLSDTGNLAVVNFPPPYFENRISDGPVAADILAEAIGSDASRSGHLLGQSDGFNYAVAGGNILGGNREDLGSQVSAYLQRVNGGADPDALYLVFMGGNDMRDARSIDSASAANAQISRIINKLDAELGRLVNAGARAFLVPNVANIGRIPETIEREQNQPGVMARAESYTRTYNQALTAMLRKYKSNPGISLVEFDLFVELENVLNNAAQFGFTNIEEGCFDPETLSIETECLIFGFQRRPFFDQLHPSSATNQLISDSLVRTLPTLDSMEQSENPIPIAAIILMLLSE